MTLSPRPVADDHGVLMAVARDYLELRHGDRILAHFFRPLPPTTINGHTLAG